MKPKLCSVCKRWKKDVSHVLGFGEKLLCSECYAKWTDRVKKRKKGLKFEKVSTSKAIKMVGGKNEPGIEHSFKQGLKPEKAYIIKKSEWKYLPVFEDNWNISGMDLPGKRMLIIFWR